MQLDTWYHVIGSHNGITARLYINGKIIRQSSSYDSISVASNDWRIGSHGSSYFFHGLIDDVRVYSTALTSEEIQKIYTETKHKYLAKE